MKYKVGDKVRIKERLIPEKLYGSREFVTQMEEYEGREAVILVVGDVDEYYLIDLDNKSWDWTDEMLESIDEKPTKFTKKDIQNGDIITTRDGYKYIKLGENLIGCSEEETLDIGLGYLDDLESKHAFKKDAIKIERPEKYKTIYEEEILDKKKRNI